MKRTKSFLKNQFPILTLFIPVALLITHTAGVDAACNNRRWCVNEYNSTTKRYSVVWWGITEVPNDIPAETLQVHIGGNRITHLAVGVFSHLSQCTLLEVSHNYITMIKEGAFIGLHELQYLYLQGNQIILVEVGAFDPLQSVHKGEIHLEGNRLRTLSPHLFTNLSRPITLDLTFHEEKRQTNQWNCVTLCWMKHEEQHGTIVWTDGSSYPMCADGSDWKMFDCQDPGQSLAVFVMFMQQQPLNWSLA